MMSIDFMALYGNHTIWPGFCFSLGVAHENACILTNVYRVSIEGLRAQPKPSPQGSFLGFGPGDYAKEK